jgi:hypothetical protein
VDIQNAIAQNSTPAFINFMSDKRLTGSLFKNCFSRYRKAIVLRTKLIGEHEIVTVLNVR